MKVFTKVKADVMTKVGELASYLSKTFASAFNIDQDKIASAFTLNFSEDELTRVVNAMMNPELWQVFVISGCIILVCALGSLLGIKISKELRKAGKFN